MVPTSPRWTELSSPAQRLVTLTGFTAAEFTEGLADISVPTSLAPTVNTVYVYVWWETVESLIDSYKAETNAYVYVHMHCISAHIHNKAQTERKKPTEAPEDFRLLDSMFSYNLKITILFQKWSQFLPNINIYHL